MSVMSRQRREKPAQFRDKYAGTLDEFLTAGGESALGRACELGRQALVERISLMEMVSVHNQALTELLRNEQAAKRRAHVLGASASFLAECLSPYEMAHRGFQDALRALRQVNETLEEEIKRIAYAVHDEAGQLLVAVHLALAGIAPELPKMQQKQVQQIEELLNQVENQLRRYSHELRPTILDDLGWIPAIRSLAESISKRSGLRIHIQAVASERLPNSAETVLYRVVQEALTNSVKHANARNVWVAAWREDFVLCCSIKDDGIGFDREERVTRCPGLGLIAMQERLNAIGPYVSSPQQDGELSF